MTREEVREYINRQEPTFLRKTTKGYICPACGQGAHKGQGITRATGRRNLWHCVNEGTERSVLGLFAIDNGIPDDREHFVEILDRAAQYYGLTIESGYHRATAQEDFAPHGNEYQNQPRNERITQQSVHNSVYTTQQEEEAEPEYTSFFEQAARDIDKTEYHRGLSAQTLARFRIGYVESWKHPKAPASVEASPRLIIPTSEHSYLARDTRADLTEEQRKYSKSKVGKVRIFNLEALQQTAQPVFIVEGEIDAMSICEVGGEAIGLGSAGNVRRLLFVLDKKKPTKPLIISLDNDKAGEKAQRELAAGLDRLGISYYMESIAAPHKDANEALMADRAAFAAAVHRAVDRVETAEAEALEEEREKLRREAVVYSLQDFLKNIEDSKTTAAIPTGFPALDRLLDGGLYAGLYIVGAISSLGKTTFCLQIADQIAASGQDVLIFSLEMARNELIAKSVSRLTLIKDTAENSTTTHAKTTRGILTGTRYRDYSKTEKELIQASVAAYGQYAGHIYITEGIGDVGVTQIREKLQRHIKLTGKPPVVVIDYLQIIAPADIRATDKQNTDKAVLELKRLSRDYGIPIIGISSFNRNSYTDPVNMAAFKESGAIEYSSDVLIGLQYEGMDYQEGESEKARDKRIRDLMKEAEEVGRKGEAQTIQVKILKNRNGSKGNTTMFFYPMFNYFTEIPVTVSSSPQSGGWSKSESGYQTTAKPKKSKREAERDKLFTAFHEVEQDGKADLLKLADALDISKRQVQNMIAEYGGFTITGETVELQQSGDAGQSFPVIEDTEELPW